VGSVLVKGLGESVSEPSSKIESFVGKQLAVFENDQVHEGTYFIWEENPKGNPEHCLCDEAWQEISSSSE
jgi:hypothetical protein